MSRWKNIAQEGKWIAVVGVIVGTVWVSAWAEQLQVEVLRLRPAPARPLQGDGAAVVRTVELEKD